MTVAHNYVNDEYWQSFHPGENLMEKQYAELQAKNFVNEIKNNFLLNGMEDVVVNYDSVYRAFIEGEEGVDLRKRISKAIRDDNNHLADKYNKK